MNLQRQADTYRLIILSSMTSKSRYGYELKRLIESLSNGSIQVNFSIIYRLLREMEDSGWISGFWEGEAGKRRRHYYNITPDGRTAFESLKKEWLELFANIDQLRRILEV